MVMHEIRAGNAELLDVKENKQVQWTLLFYLTLRNIVLAR